MRPFLNFSSNNLDSSSISSIRQNTTNKLVGGSTNYEEMVESAISMFNQSNSCSTNHQNDKYMILVTNGIGSKSHTEHGKILQSLDAVFYRTGHNVRPQIWAYGNFSVWQTYIHFVAQETRIIRKLFIFFLFFITKRRNQQCKSCIFIRISGNY